MSTAALAYVDVGFAYPNRPPVLRGLDLDVEAGEVLLVTGPSGSGKSTLLRCANGLVPHASGGRFTGDIFALGRSIRSHQPRQLADVVGFVHQDPEAQFVVDRVEADIAFVLENLGATPEAMRRRVEEVLDALGIAHLRHRSPATLSGGEKQRCAIAGALAASPAVLVLDEPTSQLDPQGAEDVLAALARLNADLGTTVVLAEHRLERAAPMADRAVVVDGGTVGAPGDPAVVLADYPGQPSVTRLGRLLGWVPPPLTVRDARRFLREYGALAPDLRRKPGEDAAEAPGEPLVRAAGVHVDLGHRAVLRDVSLDVSRGEVVALLGRNGAGKTTLLRTLAGLLAPGRGTVERHGRPAFVPQDPNALLLGPTVRHDVEETLRLLGRRGDGDVVDRWLGRLDLQAVADRHPRDLSAGQRQRVAVAAVAVGDPDVLLLDEPTRGMDPPSRAAVELAARAATRVVVLGEGDVVADGPARSVLSGSLFAPQVLRVLPPFLTVEEVADAWQSPSH
jgi:energy-coupling factor transporter ATP-binding protein EcfA2